MLISSITEAFLVWLLNESAPLYAFNWAFFQIRIWCEIQWQSCHIYWLVFTQLSVYKLYFSYLIISTFRAGNTSFSCVFPSSHLSIYRKFEYVSWAVMRTYFFPSRSSVLLEPWFPTRAEHKNHLGCWALLIGSLFSLCDLGVDIYILKFSFFYFLTWNIHFIRWFQGANRLKAIKLGW